MIQALDGPAIQFVLSSVSDTVPVKAQADQNTAFSERQVVTLQSADGKFYVYFADTGEVPTATDVSTKGFTHPKSAIRSYEAGPLQTIYVMAVSSTINIQGAERS